MTGGHEKRVVEKKGRVFPRVKCTDSEGSFIFVSFVNCDLCLLVLIVLYYCRSGRFVRLLVIFFGLL